MKTFFFTISIISYSFCFSQENIDYRSISEIFLRKSSIEYRDFHDDHFFEINKGILLDSLITNDYKTSKVLKKYFIKDDFVLTVQYYSKNKKKYFLKLFYNNKEYKCSIFFKEKINIKLIDVFFNEEGYPIIYFFSNFGLDKRAFYINFFDNIFNAGPTILRPGSIKH